MIWNSYKLRGKKKFGMEPTTQTYQQKNQNLLLQSTQRQQQHNPPTKTLTEITMISTLE